MDNTTLIVTIIGMIAAFLTASFAESIKNYFQNKAKLQNLRIALYKEIIFNYTCLLKSDLTPDLSDRIRPSAIQRIVNIECYKQAMQNELIFFYQLSESDRISTLDGVIINTLLLVPFSESTTEYTKISYEAFYSLALSFMENVAKDFYSGMLDKKTLGRIVSPNEYETMMKKGKKLLENSAAPSK